MQVGQGGCVLGGGVSGGRKTGYVLPTNMKQIKWPNQGNLAIRELGTGTWVRNGRRTENGGMEGGMKGTWQT